MIGIGAKVNPGAGVEDLASAEWNRHVDVAEWYFRMRARGEPAAVASDDDDSGLVKVWNSSGGARRQGEILEFSGTPLVSLTGDVPALWFTGGSPTLSNGFGVLARAMPSDADYVEACWVKGVALAIVNVTDTTHRFAYAAYGSYVLQSAALGPVRILSKDAGTGEKTCGVLLDQSGFRMYRGTTNAALAKGDSGYISRYRPGTTTDTTIDDLVSNEMADITASGKVVYYCDDGGGVLYLIACECPM